MATEKRLISVNEWDTFFHEHIYNRCFRNEYEQGYTDALDRVDDWMDEHPTVDAVEVVRCKDCKHWKDSWVAPDGKHEHGYCHMEEADDVIVGRWDDDFCSYGERKDNAENH